MLFDEPGADEVRLALTTPERIFASRLLRIEAERAVLRATLDDARLERHAASFDRVLRELWTRIDFFEMTKEICDLAGRIVPRARLRSLDAIHMATFRHTQILVPEITMLTFDKRLIDLL